MELSYLPEYRFAQALEAIGAFDTGYKKQVSYFDEDRLEGSDRAIVIMNEGENASNGDIFQDSNILVVFISQEDKADGVEVNMFARKVQSDLINLISNDDDFGIINNGMNGPIQMASGRQAFELRFRFMSNYCIE